MGCAASSINKEKRIQRCKERKKLMKQLIVFRREFTFALFDYLRSLNNTGSTLGQFTESDSLEQEDAHVPLKSLLPPPPPPPLPPPPPPLSPDSRKTKYIEYATLPSQEEIIELNDDENSTPPPPEPVSSINDLYPFDESMPELERIDDMFSDQVDDEDWVDARTEFEEDDRRAGLGEIVLHQDSHVKSGPSPSKVVAEIVDDSSSVTSIRTEDNSRDRAVVVYRTKKTLVGIVRELDDYFLKASSRGGKEMAVLVDLDGRNTSKRHHGYGERKGNNSGRVFGSLSWIWSSRSYQSSKDTEESESLSEPCRAGAHSITLEKLYAEEQKLHKALKEEATAKWELEKMTATLQKLEAEIVDSVKVEKTRVAVGNLQSAITSLTEFIGKSFSTILGLTGQELHPQLISILCGLLHLWRTMYECHQVQHHLSLQMDSLTSHNPSEPTSDNRHKAVVQLAEKVSFWHHSFRRFLKYQREYVKIVGSWIALVDVPVAAGGVQSRLSSLHAVCVEWQRALEKLPEKVTEEAIKSFLSSIRIIISSHEEEFAQKKKTDKLGRKLRKELNLLLEMEEKLNKSDTSFVEYLGEGKEQQQLSFSIEDLSPRHPVSVKRSRTQALKKAYDIERAKYLQSVEASRATALKNMKTSLPKVFQVLMAYSAASVQVFEAILGQVRQISDDHAEPS